MPWTYFPVRKEVSVSVAMVQAAVTRSPADQRMRARSDQTSTSWWVNMTN